MQKEQIDRALLSAVRKGDQIAEGYREEIQESLDTDLENERYLQAFIYLKNNYGFRTRVSNMETKGDRENR